MSASARLNLPFLSAGQAQKEFYHNEALQTLDLLAAAAVEEATRSDPPPAPTVGSCYIIGSSPTGEWAGRTDSVAGYTSGGWRYIPPIEGMTAYVKSAGVWACYRSGVWELGAVRGNSVVLEGLQVLGSRLPAIAGPSGGATVDAESRATIDRILAALREHGLIES